MFDKEKYADEAIDRLEKGEIRRREETKRMVEFLIPIMLGVLGAFIASLSIDAISYYIFICPFYNLFFKLSILSIMVSTALGVWFLFVEKKVFEEEEAIKALKKLDISNLEGKPDTYRLALSELSNRRVPNLSISEEYRKIFKTALDKHKNELQSWIYVANPEELYSPNNKVKMQKLLVSFLSVGGFGILVMALIFIAII